MTRTTRTVALDNSVDYKKRINICNHQPIIVQKGANLMKNNKHKNYFNKEKENLFNT